VLSVYQDDIHGYVCWDPCRGYKKHGLWLNPKVTGIHDELELYVGLGVVDGLTLMPDDTILSIIRYLKDRDFLFPRRPINPRFYPILEEFFSQKW
jgi:hypothetical protein